MTCPFCGTPDNPAAATFCFHCGASLLTTTPSSPGVLPQPAAGHFDERFGATALPATAPLAAPPPPSTSHPAITPEMFFGWRKPETAPETEPITAEFAPWPLPPEPSGAPLTPDDPEPDGDASGRIRAEISPMMDESMPPPGEFDSESMTEPIGHGQPNAAPDPAPTTPGPSVAQPVAAAAGTGPWFERHGASGPSPEPLSAQSRYWATGAHASAFVGAWLGGVPAFVGPLIVWLARKDTDPFAAEHGRNALNFNLSVIVYVLAMIIVSIFTFGIGLLVTIPGFILLGLAWFAFTLVGTIKAASSETYRYPLTIRFVR